MQTFTKSYIIIENSFNENYNWSVIPQLNWIFNKSSFISWIFDEKWQIKMLSNFLQTSENLSRSGLQAWNENRRKQRTLYRICHVKFHSKQNSAKILQADNFVVVFFFFMQSTGKWFRKHGEIVIAIIEKRKCACTCKLC